jgi:hypothetical protein
VHEELIQKNACGSIAARVPLAGTTHCTGAMGKIVFLFGLVVCLVGLLLWWKPDAFSWFGHLPGDIRIERENFSFSMPLTSMLVLSALLNLLSRLLQR